MSKNLRQSTQVSLPAEVVADIDRLVGKRSRSAFLSEVAREEILRRRQREALRMASGAWKEEDHPELKDGAAAWVRQMRTEGENREREIEERRDGA